MADTTLLIDAIKQELKSCNKTYADMAQALDISESTIKRMFSKKEMPLSRIDDVCRFLGTDFADLSRKVADCIPLMTQLTYAQEAASATARFATTLRSMWWANIFLAGLTARAKRC